MNNISKRDFESLYYLLDTKGIDNEYNLKIDSLFRDFKSGRINSSELSDKLGRLEEYKIAINKIGEVLTERLKDFGNLLKA